MNKSTHIKGLISCIIPVYNRQDLIIECVESVLAQAYKKYEIIIVDDGSTDDTADVLTNLSRQSSQIRVFSQDNQGPGAARQLGLDHAQGQYVQFLDSDDLILPHKFELFIHAFQKSEQPDIVYSTTHYYEIGNPDDYIVWKQTNKKLDTILPTFFTDRIWGTATPIYLHQILINAGKILPLSCEEDLEFECRIGLQNPKLYFVDQHLTDIRHHPGDRFSVNHANRAEQLSHQIEARSHIYQSMCAFGLNQNAEQMKHFSKTLFLFSRQSGEMGLINESKSAFNLAQQAGGKLSVKDKLAMKVYKITNFLVGPKTGAKLFSGLYNQFNRLRQN